MLVSSSSRVGFSPMFSGSSFASSKPRKLQVSLPVTASQLRQFKKAHLGQQRLFVAESDHITSNVHTHASGNSEMPNPTSLDAKNDDILPKSSPSTSSGPISVDKDTSSSPSPDVRQKRTSLTARERLRAARVLSRYNESKTSTRKAGMGSKLLDALKESEKGKKGLPEAPENMLDDSKRGMPKAGLTFSFPGGFDLFLIIFSFVFISTVMFATTYIVWKLGAIHFNEN